MLDQQKQTMEFKYTGLDKDSDLRLMNPGDSRTRLNCINDSTNDGLLGDIQNPMGTVEYDPGLPVGTNICIGTTQDIQNNAIIYFVYNSNQDHQIRRFFPDNGTDQLILQSAVLNFQTSSRIYHANVINGLLYWTDGWFSDYGYGANNQLNYNPPRKINIEQARTGGPGYAPVTFETLDRIKYQPAMPPTLKYAFDATLAYNYIFGKMFQMAYRYIYDDKEISCWSSLSKALLPAYTFQNPTPYQPSYQYIENTVVVTFNTGSEIVTDIELAYRDAEGTYFIIARLNKTEEGYLSNVDVDYTYDGIALKENLPADEYLRPFDYVPQVSKCQEYAGSRIVDWNEVENYDNVDNDITGSYVRYYKTSYTRDTSPVGPGWLTYGVPWSFNYQLGFPLCTFKSGGVYQYGIVYYDRAGRSGVVNTKEEYILTSPQYDIDADPMGGMWMDPLKMRLLINNPPPIWAKYYQIVVTKELSYSKKTMFAISAFNFDSLESKIILPDSLGYEFAEGDRLRFIATNTVPAADLNATYPIFDTSYNVASYTQGALPWRDTSGQCEQTLYGTPLVNETDARILSYDVADGSIKFDPTDIGKWTANGILGYRELFGGSTNRFFIVEIYNKNRNETDNKIFYEVGEKYEIGDPYTDDRYHKSPIQDQVVGVDPAIVDIFGFDAYVRFKRQTSQLQNFFENLIYGTQYGYSGVTGDGWSIPYGLTNNQQVSIYGNLDLTQCIPLLSSTLAPIPSTVWELTYSISYAPLNYYNFLISPDPSGTYARPDIYGFTCDGPTQFMAFVEDEAFADDFTSKVYNDGRPNTNLETLGRKDYFARGRWSEKFFQNTLVNGLSTVYEGSYRDLSEIYQEVSKIRLVGDTLRIRQKAKMNSFYIDKNMLTVNEGVNNVGQSSNFLSTENPYDEYYGTSSPGSDVISTRTAYFLDLLHGVVIRDAGNQPIAISGDTDNPKDIYRMSKYFRDLCNVIRDIGSNYFNIHAAWDEFSSLYTLTIQGLSDAANAYSQTIVFHEPTNRWKSFMSYIPEKYETLGQFLVGFKNGIPNIHYENPIRNNFYGVQYDQVMHVVSNIGRNTPKVFNNIDVYSNVPWTMDMAIPSNPNALTGMASTLPPGRFVAKEGVYHASFLRDQNDPKYTDSTLALLNGRRLRGEVMEITMTNSETDLVYLRALNIYFTPSEPIL